MFPLVPYPRTLANHSHNFPASALDAMHRLGTSRHQPCRAAPSEPAARCCSFGKVTAGGRRSNIVLVLNCRIALLVCSKVSWTACAAAAARASAWRQAAAFAGARVDAKDTAQEALRTNCQTQPARLAVHLMPKDNVDISPGVAQLGGFSRSGRWALAQAHPVAVGSCPDSMRWRRLSTHGVIITEDAAVSVAEELLHAGGGGVE